MFVDAAVIVLVLIDERPYSYGERFAPAMDAAAAIQNMLLSAKALGLGSCWVYYHIRDSSSERELRKRLGIPRFYRAYSTVCLGYPAREPSPPARKPLVETFSYNHFE